MILLFLGKHLIWVRSDGQGGTISYYYYDAITWIVAALALAWLIWFFVRRYLRARALRRSPRSAGYRLPERIIKLKRELSSMYLRPGFSTTIHAVGIGRVDGRDDYCIQVFASDVGPGAVRAPNKYRGIPVRLIEMPTAVFINQGGLAVSEDIKQYPNGIRERQDVILGGISGANSNLTGESGTIGYFCTRKSKLPRRKEIHLLSNCHVFADLRKTTVDNEDLIVQPSPGESGNNRPIASLVNFFPVKFSTETAVPNHVDAAIAKLWGPQPHKPLIPLIGAIKGYVSKKNVELGETVRKFGRTTGYTEGRVFSIYLDIWIRYDRTGQSAFFEDQFLIEPKSPGFRKFVAKGDSGSLLVDAKQHAIGLIFGGMAELPAPLKASLTEIRKGNEPSRDNHERILGYGVANPISEVLDRLKIDLLI